MIKATAILFSLLVPVHSWYPKECCSNQDCDVFPAHRVKVSGDVYVIDNMWRMVTKDVRVSPDENYHACQRHGVIVCFWAPRGSV